MSQCTFPGCPKDYTRNLKQAVLGEARGWLFQQESNITREDTCNNKSPDKLLQSSKYGYPFLRKTSVPGWNLRDPSLLYVPFLRFPLPSFVNVLWPSGIGTFPKYVSCAVRLLARRTTHLIGGLRKSSPMAGWATLSAGGRDWLTRSL